MECGLYILYLTINRGAVSIKRGAKEREYIVGYTTPYKVMVPNAQLHRKVQLPPLTLTIVLGNLICA